MQLNAKSKMRQAYHLKMKEGTMNNYLRTMFYNYLFNNQKIKTSIRSMDEFTYQVVVESEGEEVKFTPVKTERVIHDSYYAQLNLFIDDLMVKPGCKYFLEEELFG